METKEAIELIKEMKEDYLYNIQRGEADEILVEMEKGRITDIVSLLKELETENKAYKEMWEELKPIPVDDLSVKVFGSVLKKNKELLKDMTQLEQKYLGGK